MGVAESAIGARERPDREFLASGPIRGPARSLPPPISCRAERQVTILSEHRPAPVGTVRSRRPSWHCASTTCRRSARSSSPLSACSMVYSATRDNFALVGTRPDVLPEAPGRLRGRGAVVMGVLALLDYHWLEHASAVIYVVVILGLLSMFVIGSSAVSERPDGSSSARSRSSRRRSRPSA